MYGINGEARKNFVILQIYRRLLHNYLLELTETKNTWKMYARRNREHICWIGSSIWRKISERRRRDVNIRVTEINYFIIDRRIAQEIWRNIIGIFRMLIECYYRIFIDTQNIEYEFSCRYKNFLIQKEHVKNEKCDRLDKAKCHLWGRHWRNIKNIVQRAKRQARLAYWSTVSVNFVFL